MRVWGLSLVVWLIALAFSWNAVHCAITENANSSRNIVPGYVSGKRPERCSSSTTLPVVLWHGMGDSCCSPISLGHLMKKMQGSLPSTYIASLKIGDNMVKDMENSYFLHPDEQIRIACNLVRADPKLQCGFNAVGFSQGAQFLRGLVQRCEGIQVRKLISLGGQHQGVYGLPKCTSSSSTCNYMRRLLNHAAYLRWVQRSLVQATYWHDPLNVKAYQKGSTFLADINNEVTVNGDYRNRLLNLEAFVMVKFANDTMVEPVDTEWFGFYRDGQSKAVETLQESNVFLQDRLGLKQMDDDGKLFFLSLPTNHLQFDYEWFDEEIVQRFLN